MKKFLLFLMSVSIILLAGCKSQKPAVTKPEATLPQLKTAQVKLADLDETIRVSGVLGSAKSESIYNQILGQECQIAWLATEGTWVKPGDVVIKLDPSKVEKALTELENQSSELDRKTLYDITNAEKRVKNAQTTVEKAKDDLKLNQLQNNASTEKAMAEVEFLQKEMELAQGQLEKRKRLAAEKLIPATQVDEAEDEVREKQYGLEKAQRQLERNRKDTEISDNIKKLDIEKVGLELSQAKSALDQVLSDSTRAKIPLALKLEEARQNLAACEIKANLAGMLLVEMTWGGDSARPFRLGDRVWERQKLASIVDPSQMQVKCDINESDIEIIKTGQKAFIKMPAIGERILHGKIKNIDNLARENPWWQGGTPGKRIFNAIIAISENEKSLRPGMGASVEIVLTHTQKALTIPLESVFRKKGKSFVYKMQGSSVMELPVRIVKQNEMLAAVKGDLKESDRVACEKPPAGSLPVKLERRR